MVRIPEKPYAFLANERLEPSRSTRRPLFASFEQLGGEVMASALAMQDQRDHDLLVEAQNAYSASISDWRTDVEETRQGGAARGLTRDFQERHEEALQESLGRMREAGLSGKGERAFMNWAAGRESAYTAEASRFEHGQMLLHGKDMHALRLKSITESLERDPAAFPDAFKQLEESYALAVGQGIFRPEEAKLHFAETRDALRQKAFDGLYARDKRVAMDSLECLGLDAEQKNRAATRFAGDAAQGAAREQAVRDDRLKALDMRMDAAQRLAVRSGDAAPLRDLARRFEALGAEEQARPLHERAALYESHTSAVKESLSLPLPKLAGLIRELEQNSGKESAQGNGDSAGELLLRRNIFKERRRFLEQDPAAAVEEEVAASLAAGENLLAGAGQVERLTDMRLAAQATNGAPETARRVLTNAETADYQKLWRAGNADTRRDMARGLAAYGRYAGKAAEEIGLCAAETLALERINAGDPGAEAALDAMLTLRSVRESAGAHLAPYQEQGQGQNQEPGQGAGRDAMRHSHVVQAFRAAVEALPGDQRIAGMLRDFEHTFTGLAGMPGGGAQRAAAMLDGRLQGLADGEFALVYDPSVFDGDRRLENALREAQQGAALEKLAKNRDFASPEEREEWLFHVRQQGIWLNAPDRDGYVLYEPVSQMPVMDRDGKLFRLRDRDIQSEENYARAARRASFFAGEGAAL